MSGVCVCVLSVLVIHVCLNVLQHLFELLVVKSPLQTAGEISLVAGRGCGIPGEECLGFLGSGRTQISQ